MAVHRAAIVVTLFGGIVWLNVVDLWTSAQALANGSGYEANWIVSSLANMLGMQVVGGMALIKMFALGGAFWAGVVALRASRPSLRSEAMSVMVFLDVVLAAVTINNLMVLGVV